jgi:hypothetical protein
MIFHCPQKAPMSPIAGGSFRWASDVSDFSMPYGNEMIDCQLHTKLVICKHSRQAPLRFRPIYKNRWIAMCDAEFDQWVVSPGCCQQKAVYSSRSKPSRQIELSFSVTANVGHDNRVASLPQAFARPAKYRGENTIGNIRHENPN